MSETKQAHTPGPHAADLKYWLHHAVTSSDTASLYAAAHAVLVEHADLLAACKLAGPAFATLMDELAGVRATDWGKINGAAVAIERAILKATT